MNAAVLVVCKVHIVVFALVCKMGLSRAKRHRLKVREQLFDHFRSRSKLSERNIADRVGCDRRTVARWRKKFAEDPENIEDDDRSGRPFKLSTRQRPEASLAISAHKGQLDIEESPQARC